MKHTPSSTGMPERMGCVVFIQNRSLDRLMTVWGLISKKNRLAFTCNSLTKDVSLHYIKYVT